MTASLRVWAGGWVGWLFRLCLNMALCEYGGYIWEGPIPSKIGNKQ